MEEDIVGQRCGAMMCLATSGFLTAACRALELNSLWPSCTVSLMSALLVVSSIIYVAPCSIVASLPPFVFLPPPPQLALLKSVFRLASCMLWSCMLWSVTSFDSYVWCSRALVRQDACMWPAASIGVSCTSHPTLSSLSALSHLLPHSDMCSLYPGYTEDGGARSSSSKRRCWVQHPCHAASMRRRIVLHASRVRPSCEPHTC